MTHATLLLVGLTKKKTNTHTHPVQPNDQSWQRPASRGQSSSHTVSAGSGCCFLVLGADRRNCCSRKRLWTEYNTVSSRVKANCSGYVFRWNAGVFVCIQREKDCWIVNEGDSFGMHDRTPCLTVGYMRYPIRPCSPYLPVSLTLSLSLSLSHTHTHTHTHTHLKKKNTFSLPLSLLQRGF